MRSPEAVAAQRAFFNAALGKAAPHVVSGPAAPVKTAVETAAPRAPAASAALTPPFDASAPPPSRLLRPGSLIDIKV